jgi:hypothetical protein
LAETLKIAIFQYFIVLPPYQLPKTYEGGSGVVGEFRKTRHPRNVEFNEVLKACFSGAGNSRFSEVWDLRSLEFANVLSSGILIRQEEESRACGSPESQLLIGRTSEELLIREPDEDSVRDSGAWTRTNRLGDKGHFGNLSKTKFGNFGRGHPRTTGEAKSKL